MQIALEFCRTIMQDNTLTARSPDLLELLYLSFQEGQIFEI